MHGLLHIALTLKYPLNYKNVSDPIAEQELNEAVPPRLCLPGI